MNMIIKSIVRISLVIFSLPLQVLILIFFIPFVVIMDTMFIIAAVFSTLHIWLCEDKITLKEAAIDGFSEYLSRGFIPNIRDTWCCILHGRKNTSTTKTEIETKSEKIKLHCLHCGGDAEVVCDDLINQNHWYMRCKKCNAQWAVDVQPDDPDFKA